jgi:hypothetical protein
MRADSVFSILVRYPPNAARNPREDSLTQAFVATLESARTANLAGYIVSRWLSDEVLSEQTYSVSSQKFLPMCKGWIDIEFSTAHTLGSESLTLWVEVKNGAPLSGRDQLMKYAAELKATHRGEKTTLVLLTPSDFEETYDAPEELIHIRWHEVGEAISNWLFDTDGIDGPARWFVGQFLEFLVEEGLFVKEKIRQEDVCRAADGQEAIRALNTLFTSASENLDDMVKTSKTVVPSDNRSGIKWPSFWSNYGLESSQLDAWCHWSLAEREAHGHEMWAGIQFDKSLGLSQLEEALIRQLEQEGLNLGYEGSWLSARRRLPLQDLDSLGAASFSDQADMLAEWALDAFESGARIIEGFSPAD